MKTRFIACQCKDDDIRITSSSGGIFPLLADAVIKEGGVVYGAAFANDFTVEHVRITSIDEIVLLKGSKYVFSKMGNAYRNAESDLKNGKKVLFIGSPCQVATLKCFLKKDYENLILIDFICHGAPKQEIWKKYLAEIADGREIKNVFFRDKRKGWMDYSIVIEFKNGDIYARSHDDDVYMRGFSDNYTLLDTCFNCKNKGIDERLSDITLGDLWGADELAPELHDDKGTSLVMLHTNKGILEFENIYSQIDLCEIDSKKALDFNIAALVAVKPNIMRGLWIKDYKKNSCFTKTMERYIKRDLFHKVCYKIYRIYKGNK